MISAALPAPALVLALALLSSGCDGAAGAGPGEPAGGAVSEHGGARGAASAAEAAPALFTAVEAGFAPMVCGRDDAPTILEVNGGGVALFDADGDADLDVLFVIPGPYPAAGVAAGGTNRLYRNDGGLRFTDVTEGSGVDVPGFCNGVAVADVDGDGRRDVYLTRLGPNVLLRNEGGARFVPVPDAGGAAGGDDEWSTSAVFVDLDLDGDLDLFVANYLAFDPDDPPVHGRAGRTCLWKGMVVMCGPQGLPAQGDRYFRNDGGTFVDATGDAGFAVAAAGFGLGALDGDFDGNGWPDLYVANDSTPNHLWLGTGGGRVEEAGMRAGVALSARGREQAGMGLAAGDVEGDGDEDLLVTNFSMEPNALYLNLGEGRFRDAADPAGLGGPSRRLLGWGVAFLDVDLDADLDVLTANGHVYSQADAPGTDTAYAQPDVLWLGDGEGRFTPEPWPGDEPAVSRALAVGDLDDDGVLDVLVTRRAGPPALWRGLGRGHAGLSVVVRGPRGNPDALGSEVVVADALGTRRQRVRNAGGYQAVCDPRPVFAWRGPAEVSVTLPDGRQLRERVEEPGRVVIDGSAP